MFINIKVEKKIATLVEATSETTKIICGNSDYKIHFIFDEEWDNRPHKTARFFYNGTYQEVIFEGNTCPAPVISGATVVFIGVIAGDISTTTPAYVGCVKSISDLGGIHVPPPEDVYNQIMEMINKLQIEKGKPSDDVPLIDGEGTAGVSRLYSRADHVHPTDTSRASDKALSDEIERAKSAEKTNAESITRIDGEIGTINTILDTHKKNAEETQAQNVIAIEQANATANDAKATADKFHTTLDNTSQTANNALALGIQTQSELVSEVTRAKVAEQAILDALDLHVREVSALLDVDDDTLNELQEVVDYIKSNKALIDAITVNKVNVSDIVDSLVSLATNKPLSANQGRVLKALIDEEITRAKKAEADNASAITALSNSATQVETELRKAINDVVPISDVESLPVADINRKALYRTSSGNGGGNAYFICNGVVGTASGEGVDVITVDALPEEGIPLFDDLDDVTLVTIYFLTSDEKAYGYTPLNDNQKWHEVSEFFPYVVVSSEAEATEADVFYIVYNTDGGSGEGGLFHYNGRWWKLANDDDIKAEVARANQADKALSDAIANEAKTRATEIERVEEETANTLTEYVKNTDFATDKKGGIVKVGTLNYGLEMKAQNGNISIIPTNDNYFNNRHEYTRNALTIGYFDTALKRGLIERKVEFTPNEALTAQKWIGLPYKITVSRQSNSPSVSVSTTYPTLETWYKVSDLMPCGNGLIGATVKGMVGNESVEYVIEPSMVREIADDAGYICEIGKLQITVVTDVSAFKRHFPSIPITSTGTYLPDVTEEMASGSETRSYLSELSYVQVPVEKIEGKGIDLTSNPEYLALLERVKALENK